MALRFPSLAVLAAVVVGLLPSSADAAVSRLRLDWAPSDGRVLMTPPYIYATTSDGEAGASYFNPCAMPPTCLAGPSAHWLEENFAAPGSPRRISLVDDSTTQYRTFSFAIKHPFGGFGPNVTGTATITHADGRVQTVPFNVSPGPGGGVDNPQHQLGTSEGLPRPKLPRQPRPDPCTVQHLTEEFPNFYLLLRNSVRELAFRWRKDVRLLFNNIYACGKGRLTGRVERLIGGRKVLVAKGTQILDYRSPGRAAVKVKLTKRGKALRKRGGRIRVRATIGVYDSHGGKVIWKRKATLRR